MTNPRHCVDSKILHLMLVLIAFGSLLPIVLPPSPAYASDLKPALTSRSLAAHQIDHPFGQPTGPLSERHMYDLANALSNDEIATIESDASRLQRFALPVLVITVSADMSPEDANAVADSVRRDWNIETSEDADDGLVFLISIPSANPGDAIATFSWGANALPHDGIDSAVVEQVQRRWIEPWLNEPDVFEAVTYGLRRLIYHAIYDPGPAAPLSHGQEAAQTIIRWSAPVAVLGLVSIAAPLWKRRAQSTDYADWWRDVIIWLPALGLGPLSVWAHSTIGVVCTGVFLLIALTIWIRRDPSNARPGTLAQTSPTRRVASA